jgi:hypothetical protein
MRRWHSDSELAQSNFPVCFLTWLYLVSLLIPIVFHAPCLANTANLYSLLLYWVQNNYLEPSKPSRPFPLGQSSL